MQEWFEAQLAGGLTAFKGATLTGTIPVRQELLNELIARALAEPVVAGAPSPAFDWRQLARFVRSATIQADAGVVTLHVDVRI